MTTDPFFRWTELDHTSFPAWRDSILAAEAGGAAVPQPPRSYPGYPTWPLPKLRPRVWPPLDRALARRRRICSLKTVQPSPRQLARLLQASHGLTGPHGAGPVPSAGSLQALELYLGVLENGWLPFGLYHYDRQAHHLAQLTSDVSRDKLHTLTPSLELFEGGSLLSILVGDGARAVGKYGERGLRFLLLEAGHLMQNLCLVSASLGLATVPLGGFFERDLARLMCLLASDVVLYTGVCGGV